MACHVLSVDRTDPGCCIVGWPRVLGFSLEPALVPTVVRRLLQDAFRQKRGAPLHLLLSALLRVCIDGLRGSVQMLVGICPHAYV